MIYTYFKLRRIMKKASTIFLRLAIIAITVGVTALCVFLLPQVWIHAPEEYSNYAYAVQGVVAAMYVSVIPYFIGIYKAWRLLSLIDNGKPFSQASARTIKSIAILAAVITGIYIASIPFFFIWGDMDDAPGLIVIGAVLVGLPATVAVFAGLLQRLVSEASEIKLENELTV